MLRSIGRLFVLFLVLVALTVLLYGSSLLLQEADLSIPSLFRPAAGKRLLISMEGFRFARSEDGRVAWRMTARNADLYVTRDAQLKDIEVVFQEAGGKRAALMGDVAHLDMRTGSASIRRGGNDVRVVTSDGYLLTTPSLQWKAGERVVRTADTFKLLGNTVYFQGKGLEAEVDMQKLMVQGNVKAVLQE